MSTQPRRNPLPATLALLAATVGSGFALGYFVATRRTPQPPPPAHAAAPRPEGPVRVRLPDSLRANAGVRMQTIARVALAPTVELTGSVEFDPDRVADVGGRIPGRISQVFVRSGAVVRAGDPLLTVVSPTLGELLAASLSARAQLTAARTQFARLATLATQQLATGVELDEARARVATLNAELRGVDQRVRAMGGRHADVSHESSGITLRAPIAGRVVTRNALVGQVIDPTETMIRVADLSRVLVVLDAFERNLRDIAVGDRVSIGGESMGQRRIDGVVARVDSTIDRETRTAKVEVRVENTDELLRPGQFVTARINVRGEVRQAIAVPRSAIVLLEGQPTVFVEVEPGLFEPRPVGVEPGDSDRVELTRGVREGESLAIEGVFALKSELQR
jgi:cobalt-zinc-cadmium efflux system membrane fusion protein